MEVRIQGEEVIDYLQFLHESDKLAEVFPYVDVPEELVVPFIAYKQKQNSEQVTEQPSVPPLVVTHNASKPKEQTYKPRRWTGSDVHRLKVSIHNNCDIHSMSTAMHRSVSAIRNKAGEVMNAVYVNNNWKIME